MRIAATILTEPVPKGRPRATVAGGHARMYTPAKTRKSEEEIKAEIRHSLGDFQPFPEKVPIRLIAVFYRARPKNLPKKVSRPVQKPDLDNYLKTLSDALNGFAFPDDSQVTTLMVKKVFAAPGTFPRIELLLEEDS